MFETKNVMTKDVVAIKKQATINQAVETFVRNDITGLPVVNDDMTLVGIVSERDLLKLLYDYKDKPYKVEDLMTEDVVCFDQEDDLVKICECLKRKHFQRVPIVSKGKLVGIVSRKDIIAHIFKYQDFFRDDPHKTISKIEPALY